MLKLVHQNWFTEFRLLLTDKCERLRIVSPFIKLGITKALLNEVSPTDIQVVTRFNKADFAMGVSDISALKFLLDAGAEIRGIKGLHSKLYIFNDDRAVVTSANLTHAALHNNFEYGCIISDSARTSECNQYFVNLWESSDRVATPAILNRFEKEVQAARATQQANCKFEVVDEGASVGGVVVPVQYQEAPSAFVKFFGATDSRVLRSELVLDEVERSGSHWACNYSKRPRRVEEGSCMFLARLVEDRDDIIVYGRAIGMKHVDNRDEATPEDIKLRKAKARWPKYIRIHHPQFVDGTLANGVSFFQLLDDLGTEALASTQKNAELGKGNLNPRKSLMQKADARLSQAAFVELGKRLQVAFDQHGMLPSNLIDKLDKPTLPNSGNVLPILLEPADASAFKAELLVYKKAELQITYIDGRVESQIWDASKFKQSSNVIRNLRSRPQFRSGAWQEEGITNLVVRIIRSQDKA